MRARKLFRELLTLFPIFLLTNTPTRSVDEPNSRRNALDPRSSESHSHPGAEYVQREVSGQARVGGHVVRQDHTGGPFGSHQPHGCRREIARNARAIHCEPVPLGEVEEHGRVATACNHAPCRRIRFEPPLFQQIPALEAADAILAVEDVVRAAVIAQNRIGPRLRLISMTCFLATRAIANAAQNWRPDDLELYFAAATIRRDALIRHRSTLIPSFPTHGLFRHTRAWLRIPQSCAPSSRLFFDVADSLQDRVAVLTVQCCEECGCLSGFYPASSGGRGALRPNSPGRRR